ncbi:anti-sigma factor family protein [Falsiroseomonas sp. HW251]|uniref:anti-sigma factor family protein n=1 Tax=Falsiroseomonas sp. HW251 TaxID=3390998 RepID=UPI003D31C32C
MWNCKDVTERASDEAEGRLTLRERVALQAHLAVCVHCRRYLRQFARTMGLLRSLPNDANDAEGERQAVALFRSLHRKP